jgi:hypothetical protein
MPLGSVDVPFNAIDDDLNEEPTEPVDVLLQPGEGYTIDQVFNFAQAQVVSGDYGVKVFRQNQQGQYEEVGYNTTINLDLSNGPNGNPPSEVVIAIELTHGEQNQKKEGVQVKLERAEASSNTEVKVVTGDQELDTHTATTGPDGRATFKIRLKATDTDQPQGEPTTFNFRFHASWTNAEGRSQGRNVWIYGRK